MVFVCLLGSDHDQKEALSWAEKQARQERGRGKGEERRRGRRVCSEFSVPR